MSDKIHASCFLSQSETLTVTILQEVTAWMATARESIFAEFENKSYFMAHEWILHHDNAPVYHCWICQQICMQLRIKITVHSPQSDTI